MAKMRFTELELFIMCEGGGAGEMLFPAQKEKFLPLDNGRSSVLGEGLESRAGPVLSGAEEGGCPQTAKGWAGVSPLPPCLERLEIPSRALLGWGERPWLLLQGWGWWSLLVLLRKVQLGRWGDFVPSPLIW